MKLSSIVLMCLATVVGCSGGGGGGSAPSTGSVAFLVKDAPLSGLTALTVTIERVELLGPEDPFVLFEGSRRVNLLEFDEMEFLLALRQDVPPGTYEKIRLHVTDPEIEPNPDDSPVFVPAQGRLDLNPKGPFEVTPGETLAIRIDFDARNAVHVVLTGSDRYIVRPVIFVKIENDFAPIPFRDFSGTVLERDLVAGTLRVEIDDRAGQVTVRTDAETTVFNQDLAVDDLAAIEVGDRVLVRGRLRRAGTVRAELVFEGDPLRLTGRLPQGSGADPFVLDVDPDQVLFGQVDTTFVDGARQFILDGREVPFAELPAGARGLLTGRFFVNDNLYRVGLMDIEVEKISGVIDAIDLGGNPPKIDLRDADGLLQTVALDDDTILRLVGDGFLAPELLSVGLLVEVDISGELNGFRRADEIRVEPLSFSGEVLAVDASNRELLLRPEGPVADLLLRISPAATILEVTHFGSTPIELDDVEPGDRVTALGLTDAVGTPLISTLIVFVD